MLPWFGALMAGAGLLLAGLAGYVGWRHGARSGVSLAVLLGAVAWWGLAYALELSATEVATKSRWGDWKYLGVATLAPAWLVFVLQYTNRGHLVTRRLLAALTVEPVVVMVALLVPATHDLVRFYPADAAGQELPVVGTGPLFWVHLVYANLVILTATVLFVVSMARLSRTYRQMALVLVAAALLPWAVNLLHNFEVGWFARLDLTPFAFTVTGGVLVWGLFRERLVRLTPLARGVIVEKMSDGVFVLDAFGRIADVNPAGARLLATARSELVGHALAEVLSGHVVGRALATESLGPALGDGPLMEVALSDPEGRERTYELRREVLYDARERPAGELVTLRDITDRIRAEQALERLLAEQSRVAAALQQSLAPAALPALPGVGVTTRYEPAGDGHEIGGDFFDLFPLGPDTWGVVLGDVSGKGAEAAAVTALARYTLRAIADPNHEPSRTLRELNTRILAGTEAERHCTVAYALLRLHQNSLEMTLSLAGHHPPLVARHTGAVEPFGGLGTVLGLLQEVELHDARVVLHPGDLVCLFTDGLVEARDQEDLFGSERVAAILHRLNDEPLEDLATELVEAPRRFHGRDLADDLAILLLRVEEHPSADRS